MDGLREQALAVMKIVQENNHLMHIVYLCVILGLFSVLSFLHDVVRGVWASFFRGGKNLKKVYGSWAVVTGATDGIGKGMAFEFARKGQNVVLISRTQSKLDDCAEELKAKYPNVEVKVLAVDYGKFDQKMRTKVESFLKDLEIGVLVNNVGVSYPFPQYFNELTDDKVEEMITLNVNSTTWMTRIVLPNMLARKKGAIVNMASTACMVNSPLLAGYGAAKGYIKHFTECLNLELKGKGVHVQCQVPLFVATKLAKIRKSSLFVPSPAGYARAGVAAIGYGCVITPFWAHKLQLYLMNALPEFLTNKIVFDMHLDLRKRALKKEANKKA